MAASTSTASVEFTGGTQGTVFRRGDAGWDAARTPWVINVAHDPAAVALVATADDVVDAVQSAGACGLHVLAEGTGHGATPVGPLADTVLLRTSALKTVDVDPATSSSWVGAGAEWGQVSAAAAEHGLVAQAGSAADVGVAGFLLSGGVSWLARSHGLAVNDILAVEMVDCRGVIRVVDAATDPDLFWAIRGGGGGLGVVTRFRLRLHTVPTIVAGTLFFPIARGGEVLHAWRRWTTSVPEQTMSCARLLQFPPLPELPDHLRGQALVSIEIVHQGGPDELAELVSPLRELGPSIDTIAVIPAPRLAELHLDPPGPTPACGGGLLLDDLPAPAVDALISVAGHGSGSPLLSVELRHLGGAVGRSPEDSGAVGHFDARFLMYAVGITPDGPTTVKVADRVARVERTLSPWAADIQYANFVEHPCDRKRFHDRDTLRRLQRIKAVVDPDGMFLASHPIPADLSPKS